MKSHCDCSLNPSILLGNSRIRKGCSLMLLFETGFHLLCLAKLAAEVAKPRAWRKAGSGLGLNVRANEVHVSKDICMKGRSLASR